LDADVKLRAILEKVSLSDTQIAQLVERIACIAANTRKIRKNEFGQSDQATVSGQSSSPDSTDNYKLKI
jgi:hypothetical protein